MKLIVETSDNPRHNLAREEILMESVTEDTLYLWRNRDSVILGKNQNASAEVKLNLAEETGTEVVRRITGGGAVFHDMGNVNFSCIFADGDFDEKVFTAMKMILSFLESLGVSAMPSGRNDICVENGERMAKICGTAMTQKGSRGIFHSCMLFDTDLDKMNRILTPPAEKLKSKGIKSVKARVVNLRDAVPAFSEMDADTFFERWEKYMVQNRGCEKVEQLTEDEELKITKLIDKKYGNNAWNFRR